MSQERITGGLVFRAEAATLSADANPASRPRCGSTELGRGCQYGQEWPDGRRPIDVGSICRRIFPRE